MPAPPEDAFAAGLEVARVLEAAQVPYALGGAARDVVDVERLIAVSADAIDAGYVRARLVEMMRPEDARVATWDRLWATHRPA